MASPTASILVLSERDIRRAVTAAAVVDSQDLAFRLLCRPQAVIQGQMHHGAFAPDSMAFVHSAIADGMTGVVFKTGTQHPANSDRGLPTVHATVTLHSPETGETLAVLNGTTVTTLRTSGGLVSAARALAVDGQVRGGVFGSGVQATELALLMHAVMSPERVLMWSPNERSRARLQADPRLRGLGIAIASSARALCEGSNVIATCTSSRTPVFDGRWVQPGTTVLTMGCYEPGRCEIDLAISARADVTVVDRPESLASNGPLRKAALSGAVLPEDAVMLGDVLTRDHRGRSDDQQIIVFHSHGAGVQDAALAWVVYDDAVTRGVGTQVAF